MKKFENLNSKKFDVLTSEKLNEINGGGLFWKKNNHISCVGINSVSVTYYKRTWFGEFTGLGANNHAPEEYDAAYDCKPA
jgi:hypothetical protein